MMSVESMRKVIVCPTRLPMHWSEKDLKTSLHLAEAGQTSISGSRDGPMDMDGLGGLSRKTTLQTCFPI